MKKASYLPWNDTFTPAHPTIVAKFRLRPKLWPPKMSDQLAAKPFKHVRELGPRMGTRVAVESS
ncbi:hypothetical protein FJ946_29660 [Mesorhizobium sp. B2-4-7]|uniref:hypothetical protein n=1 Tax=unclassified Mesorhizobium TaxID=325217 RepID=UPI00112BF4A5|nr:MULTISPECIES: hypothetical protein [unclassified Mesorhizobium]TPK43538.1 hypothetical protein FJ550_29035 [Mesorhizobium sp. B2-5-2]TPL16497.1 hypothetical protein FJ946_29660 [Mesorhizobium sp. B2-4-7]TPM70064.1 hypothetical protein FJ968_26640 [Mesorhizobium sp. B2-1-6]TPN75544.1 hypothetical protein FJ985_15880 [Mesorhizobium sp. B1-1-2]TPN15739.1 hypothetical protein FJ973_09230 [Mesorhizobium sp. B2-1-3]